MVVRLDGGDRTKSIPDETIERGLDYCRALGLVVTWEVLPSRRRRPRRYLVRFAALPDRLSELGAGAVAAYVAGVHDMMTRTMDDLGRGFDDE